MIPKVVSIPFRIGLSATRITLGLSTKLASAAAGAVFHVVESQFSSPQPTRSSSAGADPSPPTAEATSTSTPDRTVRVQVDVVVPDEQPGTPLVPHDAAVKTDDDEDEVVAEFAEVGAEDGAGAQLHVEEPWEGYDSETAEAVTAQIAEADAAALALLELYEQTHKQRKTVLEAAVRRLRELSPPDVA